MGKHTEQTSSPIKVRDEASLVFFFLLCPFLCGRPGEWVGIPIDSMRRDVFPFTNAKVGMSANPQGLNGASSGVSLS